MGNQSRSHARTQTANDDLGIAKGRSMTRSHLAHVDLFLTFWGQIHHSHLVEGMGYREQRQCEPFSHL